MWTDDFLQAADKAELNVVPDSQNGRISNGISVRLHCSLARTKSYCAQKLMFLQPIASWVDPSTGRRQDVAHVLLHPLLDTNRTKLKVITDHSVVRVLFDGNKCSGVDIISDKSTSSHITIQAKIQVILCAGTINSPQILERSGIGNPSLLLELGIPVISPLPGVGTSYQDHHFVPIKYKSCAPSTATHDALWRKTISPTSPEVQASGILAFNSGVIGGKIRPSAKELSQMSPRFQSLYRRDFQNTNKPLALIYGHTGYMGNPSPPKGQYISIGVALAHSYSRGYVHIKGTDIQGSPDFDAGTLTDINGADVEVLVWAYKRSREMVRRMRLSEGGLEDGHPRFSKTSEAAIQRDAVLVKEFRTGNTNEDRGLKDIVYNKDDDQAIEEFVKAKASTFWHYAGTCAMKPQREGGVVDSSLNVYGVQGLKVAGEKF